MSDSVRYRAVFGTAGGVDGDKLCKQHGDKGIYAECGSDLSSGVDVMLNQKERNMVFLLLKTSYEEI